MDGGLRCIRGDEPTGYINAVNLLGSSGRVTFLSMTCAMELVGLLVG